MSALKTPIYIFREILLGVRWLLLIPLTLLSSPAIYRVSRETERIRRIPIQSDSRRSAPKYRARERTVKINGQVVSARETIFGRPAAASDEDPEDSGDETSAGDA